MYMNGPIDKQYEKAIIHMAILYGYKCQYYEVTDEL